LEQVSIFIGIRNGATIFEGELAKTTLLALFEDVATLLDLPYPFPGYKLHRERINAIFDTLPELANKPGPQFVFAHVVVPHPPFVFTASGEPAQPRHPFYLADASQFLGTREEYMQGYIEQLIFVNKRLRQVLPALLASPKGEPIIILQGDHGPGAFYHWTHPSPTGLYERLSILNAIFLPGASSGDIPPDLSSVNNFRWVLRNHYGLDIPLLENRWYHSSSTDPLDLTPVAPNP
jgi:hypothetical protein